VEQTAEPNFPHTDHTLTMYTIPTSSLPPPLSSFVHSGYFYSASSCPLLLRGAPEVCRSFKPKHHMILRVNDLPKVPTWRLERDSNQWPFGRKATNLPSYESSPHHLHHHFLIPARWCWRERINIIHRYRSFVKLSAPLGVSPGSVAFSLILSTSIFTRLTPGELEEFCRSHADLSL